jgi:transcriptional regulator with XRE-family HTH domain/tetratricopeptide (TPR) repeat protein
VVKDREAPSQDRVALGAELAAYRRAAGCTQARLAQRIGYSRSTIANVETGRQHVPRGFWEGADAALRTGGTLATGYDELDAAARRDLRVAARQVSTARQAHGWHRGLDLSTTGPARGHADDCGAQARSAESSWWPAGQKPAASAGRETAVALTDGNGTAVRDAGQRRVTPGDVIRLRGMRLHLKAIDNAHGGGAALPMATWYLRDEVLPLLNGPADDLTTRALIEVVAEVEQDLAWMAYDAGKQDLATGYFTSALRLARQARNRLLGGRILAAMSHQAIYLGSKRQGIDFAQAARNLTRQIATPRVIAMEAAMEACAHAAAGDAGQCHRALGDAADSVALLNVGQDDPDWLDFDEGGYWGHAARAYRDLGELRKAEECAEKSVGLCLPEHSRTRAQRNTIQATAHLRMGEVDAAAAAAERVVREAWNLNSGHVFGEVADLVAAMAPFGTPVASEFLDQARELLAARRPAEVIAAS